MDAELPPEVRMMVVKNKTGEWGTVESQEYIARNGWMMQMCGYSAFPVVEVQRGVFRRYYEPEGR